MSHFSIINYKENDLNKHFTYYMPTSSLWMQTYIIPKYIRSSIRWALFSCIKWKETLDVTEATLFYELQDFRLSVKQAMETWI